MISGGKTLVSEIDLFVSKTRSPKTTAKLIRTTSMVFFVKNISAAIPAFFSNIRKPEQGGYGMTSRNIAL